MRLRPGIRRKLWVVFVLQVVAISFATVLGVFGAASVLEDVLIRRALTGEADFFWQRRAQEPDAPAPQTNNMTGYLVAAGASTQSLPAVLRPLQPGYQRVPGENGEILAFVADGPTGRLYLVFNPEQIGRLAFLFGFIPLILVLIIIYITTWLAYRASRRALSPVVALAKVVRDWDPKEPDLAALSPERLSSDPDGDVETLARALHGYASRIEEFVARERDFTRDASHEMRSPLTVIKVAAEVLQEEELSPFGQRTVLRIQRSAQDMEALMEAFLILAREADTGLPEEDFIVNDIVREEVERAQPLVAGRPLTLALDEPGAFALHAPPKVLAVLVGNLIRNACLYTESGEVRTTVGMDYIRIQDSGIGMSEEEVARAFQPFFRGGRSRRGGHGVGLTIVKRLSDRFSWPVEMTSEMGHGTSVTIHFPQARAETLLPSEAFDIPAAQ
ncbi:MAG TPA: HAMP domain-containing sensor histidine kinase [Rudaea sp.]|nr:HAMP domain-containing sensor histidine kinase [Rudaea sp.]HSC10828.1 HAMP domain-containing sensor histidine kinase [Rhodanobacteraceae bacterium]